MKNVSFKNAFIAAGLAVFAGVLTLGVNAAFGVSSPSEKPETSGLVSPTFNGMDVQGEISNSKGNVTIDGTTDVNGQLTVSDDAAFNGNLTVGKTNPSILRQVQINGNTGIKGNLNLEKLYAKGDISADGDITSGASIEAAEWVKTKDLNTTGVIFSDGDAYFKHIDVFNQGIGSVLMKNGEVKASGNISTSGKILSKGGFGTYINKHSAMVGFAAVQNNSQSATVQCSSGSYIVSCGAGTADIKDNYSDWTRWINVSTVYADTSNQTCKVRGTNNSTSVHYIWAEAVCLNPNL